MTTSYAELARRVVRLEKRVSTSTPQLVHSTIEGGAIAVRENGGQLPAQVGKHADGTWGAFPLSGPTPPTPVGPTVTQIAGGFKVHVPGEWIQPALVNGLAPTPVAPPLDFSSFEIHVTTNPNAIVPVFSSLKASISSPRGGDAVVFLDPTTEAAGYYFRVYARALSGKVSFASEVTGPLQPGKVGSDMLDIDLDALGGNQIFYGPDEPTAGKAGDLWLREPDNVAHRWDGALWVETQDQGIVKALQDAQLAQETAASKPTLFEQPEMPTGLDVDAIAVWRDTDDNNRQYSWVDGGWVPRLIGNSSIEPASLVARDVVATGSVSAALLETILILATTIVAGDPTKAHARMTPDGFFVFAADPNTGELRQVVRLGVGNNDYFGIYSSTGEALATIDERGYGSFAGLSVREWPSFGGDNLRVILNRLPRGVIAVGQRDFTGGVAGIVGEEPLFDVAAVIERDRMYQIHLAGYDTNVSGGASQTVVHRIRLAYGDTPTINNPIVMNKQQTVSLGAAADYTTDWPGILAFENFAEQTRLVRFGMSIGKGSNTGNSLGLAGLITLTIVDVGPAVSSVVTFNPGGQGYGSTAPVVSTPATERRVLERVANWSRSFTPTNGIVDDPNVYQGYSAATGGDMAGMWGFPDMTAELSGAIIEEIFVYLYATHWHYNAGGTAIISTHAQLGEPATWSKYETDPNNLVNFLKPEGKWVQLDVARYGERLKSGTFRGITVGRGGGTNLQFYGRFHGAGELNPARIRVQYVK